MGAKEISLEKFVNTKFIAEDLSKDIRTIQRWIKEGFLPAVKLGRDYLVSSKDYQEFKSKNMIKV